MKLAFLALLCISATTFAHYKPDVREHCALGKIYAADNMIKAQALSDYYFFVGKHSAYEEIIEFIDEEPCKADLH